MKKPVYTVILLIALAVLVCSPLLYADDDKPVMFFNTYTRIGAGNLVAVNGAYRAFADMAEEAGFIVNHGKILAYDDEFFADIDVLVMSVSGMNLTREDKEAMKQFLRDGGAIFILTYSERWFLWINNGVMGSFTSEFGIRFRPGSPISKKMGYVVDGSILSGPDPVNQIQSPTCRVPLNVDESLAEVQAKTNDGEDLVAIAKLSGGFSPGKLIVHGDASMIARETLTKQLDLADNRALASNIIQYLLGGNYDLMIKKTKVKGRNILAGDTVKIVTKIKNLGEGDSEEATITHVLAEFSQAKGGPGDELGTLGTNTVNSIKGSKKTKMFTIVKIPSNLSPGEYVVITTIDIEDKNADNNIKSSKKFFVN